MYHVEFENPHKPRTAKDSVALYRKIIETRKIPPLPPKIPLDQFPEGFIFGSASSAYQVEGGWNADGKGESIWDHLVHTRPQDIGGPIHSGDVAANSFEFYKDDIRILKELGVSKKHIAVSIYSQK